MTALVVDSHCHLDFPDLQTRIDAVVAAAGDAGVGLMLSISSRVRKFDNLLAIAERYPQVYCTVGTHPHHAHEEPEVTAADLVQLAQHPKVIGIGEAGLDHHYDFSPREAQVAGFRSHIAAARESGLPLVIHSREAEEDTARILEEEMAKGAFSAVLHCFTSQQWLAEKGIALGLYVSFSGILTYKSAEDLRKTATALPADRILVETDAPYLAPVPMRGKTNEPAYVAHTLRCLAETRGVSVDVMAQQTTKNFFSLFSKAKAPAGVGAAA
jgi:TatD DNase family protein